MENIDYVNTLICIYISSVTCIRGGGGWFYVIVRPYPVSVPEAGKVKGCNNGGDEEHFHKDDAVHLSHKPVSIWSLQIFFISKK